MTRMKSSRNTVQCFEHAVKSFFQRETLIGKVLSDVKYFAAELCLSSNYVSDLLKRYFEQNNAGTYSFVIGGKSKNALIGF
jgi:hypothetical protein